MSGIPPNAPWRGCSSSFPLPLNQEDRQEAEGWTQTLHQHNPDIVYRSGDGEHDILHHVLRWDDTHYEQVFQNGFLARPQDDNTPNKVYYNLYGHVRSSGPHIFVTTTLSHGWYPPVHQRTEIYRYEIYAPGGIWVAQTLDRSRYPRQDEVAFVGGIAPQYIRSAQRFRAIDDPSNRQRRIWQPADTRLIINRNFNPRLLDIQNPIVDQWDPVSRRRVPLEIIFYEPPHAERRKREVSTPTDSNTIHWYAEDVANIETYIDAAFRSSHKNEAYLFMKNEYVQINYAPGTTNDKVLDGPLLSCDGYPSLKDTAFAEYGINCAFGSHDENEAFIFSGNLCARIDFEPRSAPHCFKAKILKGPMTIAKMFPYLKETVFESGIDAAFESTRSYEAYLFKGDQYARINYASNDSCLIGRIGHITGGYPSLKRTIFESGIDAAFASHKHNEAYIFKGDSYARINFAPGTTDDYIIGSVRQILPYWPSLHGILPWQNRGLDVHDHPTAPDSDGSDDCDDDFDDCDG